ncbi:hypothetical protein UFOVP816_50 [uncultured Caudovirales phage]|uniref:Uncharacterized protein n=1 Tax=uncultured Caudovirales phage TaxID=2100421 RepID=A0A6J5P3P2_9CAUD|nr:hypothetical protein UFOVP816_50 [uncultured Caudovirales phage]
MKVNILDAHDRFQHLKKQSFNIGECCQDLINQRPFGEHPFYIFAHARTADDGVTKRMIWQPRLTKPRAQTNSMLFKAYPGSDNIKIIWMIPERSMWKQYEKGKLTENELVSQSIHDFENNRDKLEAPEEDDLNDRQVSAVYSQIALTIKPRMPF